MDIMETKRTGIALDSEVSEGTTRPTELEGSEKSSGFSFTPRSKSNSNTPPLSTEQQPATEEGRDKSASEIPVNSERLEFKNSEFENSETKYVDFIDPSVDEKRYAPNDLGMGYLFADTFRNRLRYVRDAKSWFYYNGCVWKEDVGGVCVRQCAKVLIQYLKDKHAGEEFYDDLSKRSKRETMMKEAQDVYSLSLGDFDTISYLLNCLNGTINLQTDQFNPHNPDDFLRKKVNAIYDPEVKCERWGTFTSQIMCGDKELELYLQKCLGYGLAGDASEECLFILYGPTTRNGKGTLMESIYHVLGDYAKTAQPSTLAYRKANGSSHSDDIAQLSGIRFVNVSELPSEMKLDSALVKQITGGDTVMARRIYQSFFEYRPQFKIFINTNHLPNIEDGTLFSSGRLKLIPFDKHFNAEEQDPGLKKLFREDNSRSAILNWLLEGYRCYISDADRLSPPQKAKDLLREYRLNNDSTGLYIEKCLIPCNTSKTKDRTKTSDFYKDFLKWCENLDVAGMSQKEFVADIRNKNLLERDRKIGHYIRGYRIKGSQ